MNYLFPERFQELLNGSSMKYGDIIQSLGIKSKGTISKYASGSIKNVSISTICKIADLFDVSPVWLIGWTDDKHFKFKD